MSMASDKNVELELGNTSREVTQTGPKGPRTRFAWTVFLHANHHVAPMIEKVVYNLHETFKQPVITVSKPDSSGAFVSKEFVGWGTFVIEVDVHWSGRVSTPRTSRFSHSLSFDAPRCSNKVSVTVQTLASRPASASAKRKPPQGQQSSASAASASGYPAAPAASQPKLFDGNWEEDGDTKPPKHSHRPKLPPGVVFTIKGSTMTWPNVPYGGTNEVTVKVRGKHLSCDVGPNREWKEGVSYTAVAQADGRILWDNGDMWVRSRSFDRNLELIDAASKCDLGRVKSLLAEGASAAFLHEPHGTWGAADSKTALHTAIACKFQETDSDTWREIVKVILDAKANVNAVRKKSDWRGSGGSTTAFEMALPALMRDSELLQLFLVAGADANTKSVENKASMRTDGRIVRYIIHKAIDNDSLEALVALINAGAEVDARATVKIDNERGYDRNMSETPLHVACSKGSLPMVALLLARGADVDAVRKDTVHQHVHVDSATDDPREDGFISDVLCVEVEETALHRAIQERQNDLVTLLVCAGADATKPRVFGEEQFSVEDLCGDDTEIRQALQAKWTTGSQHLLPPIVQESVLAALAIANKHQWALPGMPLFKECAMASGTERVAEPA